MFLNKPDEKDLKEITLDEFENQMMKLIQNNVQPERLNPEDHIEDNLGMICDSPNTANK